MGASLRERAYWLVSQFQRSSCREEMIPETEFQLTFAILKRTRCRNITNHDRISIGMSSDCFVPFMLVGARSFGRIAAMRLTAARSRLCGKTACFWCRKWCSETRARAFVIRLCAVAAVQEMSWPICGGFGRLRRAGIRHLRHMDHVIGAAPAQECV